MLNFFRNQADPPRLQVGIFGHGVPVIRMAGNDGKGRINLALDEADQPKLIMSDKRWQGTGVQLGFIPQDHFPYNDWDDWGLLFCNFGSERPAVGMGLLTTHGKLPQPFIRIAGKNVR